MITLPEFQIYWEQNFCKLKWIQKGKTSGRSHLEIFKVAPCDILDFVKHLWNGSQGVSKKKKFLCPKWSGSNVVNFVNFSYTRKSSLCGNTMKYVTTWHWWCCSLSMKFTSRELGFHFHHCNKQSFHAEKYKWSFGRVICNLQAVLLQAVLI